MTFTKFKSGLDRKNVWNSTFTFNAGLRIDPLLSDIDSQWIVYNRPQDLTNKHAGFLFALG